MRKNVKKLAVVFLAVCLCMTALVGCKAKTDPDLWVENPSGVAAEDLTLSDEQMVAALTELARRTENQMLAVDPHAKVEFRVAEDGSCGFYAAGTEEDGTVSEEMEEISTAESVKAFFDSYYEAGFFDAEGNLLGFPEEVPDDELAQEQPDTDIQEILLNYVIDMLVDDEQCVIAFFTGHAVLRNHRALNRSVFRLCVHPLQLGYPKTFHRGICPAQHFSNALCLRDAASELDRFLHIIKTLQDSFVNFDLLL